ncbi:hypothetical protein Hanom_Chr03g00261291 [Helianthus anomalus]
MKKNGGVLTSWLKMTSFQTFWTRMRKNKHLDESRKNGQTSGTIMAFQKKFITGLSVLDPFELWQHMLAIIS